MACCEIEELKKKIAELECRLNQKCGCCKRGCPPVYYPYYPCIPNWDRTNGTVTITTNTSNGSYTNTI